MSIIGWIVFGAIVGALARLLMPGPDRIGCLLTVLLGILGSVIGGLLLGFLLRGRGTDPAGWIGSILGAILLLWLYRKYRAPDR